MAILFSDDFNRSDSASLGSNWTETIDNFSISSNKCVKTNPFAAGRAVCNYVISGADYNVSADWTAVATGNGKAQLLTRYQDANNYYLFQFGPTTDSSDIWKIVGGAYTRLDFDTGTWSYGNTYALKFQALGSELKVFVDGGEILSATDSAITSAGSAAIDASSNTSYGQFDNFSIDDDFVIKRGGFVGNLL